MNLLVRWRALDPVWIVIALFAVAAMVIPTMADVATTDDWGYSRPVEIFRDTHHLGVFPVVAATSIAQIVWGIAFSYVFGMSLGTMRLSTVVLTALGALAFGWMLRQLGLDRARAAFGVALYLFNPLQFILAFTFMTDANFTALMTASVAFYVRGIGEVKGANKATLFASALAGCAFLIRQQGALIPLAVCVFILVDRWPVWCSRATFKTLLRVIALPTITVFSYAIWLRFANDVPDVQTSFLDEARESGLAGAWQLVRHLTFIQAMYCGAFVLPLTLAVIPRLVQGRFTMRRTGWLVLGTSGLLFGAALFSASSAGKHMPYVPQFIGAGGLGPADIRGSRARIVEQPWFDVATVICAVSVLVAIALIARSVTSQGPPIPRAIVLIGFVGIGQFIGLFPPSFHYLHRGYSLDRYLLPLAPFAIAILLWATREIALVRWLGWLSIAVLLVVNTALTRDYLVFMQTVWRAADSAVVAGARENQIDAGAAWDGYHLYTDGLDEGITRARTRGGPWWTYFYGKATNSEYVVTSKPLEGYVVIGEYRFQSWLPHQERTVYLVRMSNSPDLLTLQDDTAETPP